MVRVAVGSMVDVAQGRMTPEEFEAALASGERRLMGQTAPAAGWRCGGQYGRRRATGAIRGYGRRRP